MFFTKEKAIPMYMLLNGLSSIVPTVLNISLAITLFDHDTTGYAAAYLDLACLLGISCAGLFGGFFLQKFSFYAIGVTTLFFASCTLFGLLCYGEVTVSVCTVALWMLSCIMSIEHSNGLAFINTQIDTHAKPLFFSTFQLFLQLFNVLAPLGSKKLLETCGLKFTLLFCVSIYLVRIIPWQLFLSISHNSRQKREGFGLFSGFKEIVVNPGLLRMTSFRMINHIPIITYTVSLPILIARMAKGDGSMNAQLHSWSVSIMNIGFILSGTCGSWLLKKRPSWIVIFFNISPIITVLSVLIAFYVKVPVYLKATAFMFGIGLYFFKTSNSVIGQALTERNKLAYVILAGDAVVKAFAYIVGAWVPCFMFLSPSIGGIPPFLGGILCSLFSLKMTKSIVRIYMHALNSNHRTNGLSC